MTEIKYQCPKCGFVKFGTNKFIYVCEKCFKGEFNK